MTTALQGCSRPDASVDHLDELPWVRVLKVRYPQDYARLRDAVAKAPDFKEASVPLGETVSEMTVRQRPKADAETARALFLLRRDEGRALQAVDPAGCAAFLAGEGTPPSFARIVTPELARRDRETVAQLLEQTAVRPAPPAAPMTLEVLARISFNAISDFPEHDQDTVIRLLKQARNPSTPDEARAMCAYQLALADELLARPPIEGGATIRSLLALYDQAGS